MVDESVEHSTTTLRRCVQFARRQPLSWANRTSVGKRFRLGSLVQHGVDKLRRGCLSTATSLVRLGCTAIGFSCGFVFELPIDKDKGFGVAGEPTSLHLVSKKDSVHEAVDERLPPVACGVGPHRQPLIYFHHLRIGWVGGRRSGPWVCYHYVRVGRSGSWASSPPSPRLVRLFPPIPPRCGGSIACTGHKQNYAWELVPILRRS